MRFSSTVFDRYLVNLIGIFPAAAIVLTGDELNDGHLRFIMKTAGPHSMLDCTTIFNTHKKAKK